MTDGPNIVGKETNFGVYTGEQEYSIPTEGGKKRSRLAPKLKEKSPRQEDSAMVVDSRQNRGQDLGQQSMEPPDS
ncbi:OLC1v1031054C1 [Oldenlandia corymbosa var. corymbosa]|uniref:OLC1v1031054C1 n=1 Tax=Oldenlandia corymbosa var. corymbosa TaxID=529605 RepID=A0AAV1CKH9_OLDCO|nr:OLC1v1031054C1 [Oldenlandia corymbosa var. corymbosa]